MLYHFERKYGNTRGGIEINTRELFFQKWKTEMTYNKRTKLNVKKCRIKRKIAKSKEERGKVVR